MAEHPTAKEALFAAETFCLEKSVTYENRVDDPLNWNWCLVPDGGYDAVFFAAIAIAVMCFASPKWDALHSFIIGGIYQIVATYFNVGHVGNAVNLWLGMRPADIFVFVFLPPLLMDSAIRLDIFMLRKIIFPALFMAFGVVIMTCLALVPFMLYGLNLQNSGWSAGYVALFGAAISSTDAAAVVAALTAGGAPELLSVILQAESLMNDASSLTLFEIFKHIVVSRQPESLDVQIGHIVSRTVETALLGVAVGLGMGIFNWYFFRWLQYRNMPDYIEVAFTVSGAYLSFYIVQVWCVGSGAAGVVAYGLYGSATLMYGMSNKSRQSGVFAHFWETLLFIVNALIFFFVGASAVNFTTRSSATLYGDGGASELIKVALVKLPAIYVYVFALRMVLTAAVFKVMGLLRVGSLVSFKEVLFLSHGGIRGSLSLVLAQTIATLATGDQGDIRVKAEAAMYTAGFVIMTLVINAPTMAPLLTLLKLNKVNDEQLLMRGHVKDMFYRFTSTALEEMQEEAEEDEMLQGVDWAAVEISTDFQDVLDAQLPEAQPSVHWFGWAWLVGCITGLPRSGARAVKRAFAKSKGSLDNADALENDEPEGLEDAKAAKHTRKGAWRARRKTAAVREQEARLKDELKRMTANMLWTMKPEVCNESRILPQGISLLIISDSDATTDRTGLGGVMTQAHAARYTSTGVPRAISREWTGPPVNIHLTPAADVKAPIWIAPGVDLSRTSTISTDSGPRTDRSEGLTIHTEVAQATASPELTGSSSPPSNPVQSRLSPCGAQSTASRFAKTSSASDLPNLQRTPLLESLSQTSPQDSLLPLPPMSMPVLGAGNEEGQSVRLSGSQAPLQQGSVQSTVPVGGPSRVRQKSRYASQDSCLSEFVPPGSEGGAPPDLSSTSAQMTGQASSASKDKPDWAARDAMRQKLLAPCNALREASSDPEAYRPERSGGSVGKRTAPTFVIKAPLASQSMRIATHDASQELSGAKQKQAAMIRLAMAGQGPADRAERIIQRRDRDGSLSTTSMQMQPLGRGSANMMGGPGIRQTGRPWASPGPWMAQSSVVSTSGHYPAGGDTLPQSDDRPPLTDSGWAREHAVGQRACESTVFSVDAPPAGFRLHEGEQLSTLSETAEARQHTGPSVTSGRTLGSMSVRGSTPGQTMTREQRGLATSSKAGNPMLSRLTKTTPGQSRRMGEGSDSRPGGLAGMDVERGEDTHAQMMTEYRLRLLTGLKSYFKGKYIESILSPSSYSTLHYVASQAHHHAQEPLMLWQLAKQEVSSGTWLQHETHMYYRIKGVLKKCKAPGATWLAKQVGARLLVVPVWLLSSHLARVQLAGLEAAVELWISLTTSLQTQWLEYSGSYGALLLQEVRENAEHAWSFIVDRRIEDPEKFQSIQTYRACVQVLSQQLAFVSEMSHGGLIDEKEAVRMVDAMQQRLQSVSRAGPQWRRQSINEILSAIPFLRGIHPKVIQWIRANSQIGIYGQGECIWEHWSVGTPPPGLFIVISGVVRMMLKMDDHMHMQPMYLGSGGVGGLVGMVLDTNEVVGMGMRAAYAEGNALGKGPVVMHIPRELFTVIRYFSRQEGLSTWQQLELSIFRTAAGYILELLKAQVTRQLSDFLRGALVDCIVSKRLDSRVAKRQRIRALLKDALEVEGDAALVDWPGELLALPHKVAVALLDGDFDETLANAPWHQAMFQAITATTAGVYEVLRAALRESWLVVLAPGQQLWQTSTMVLIQGSLKAVDMEEEETQGEKETRAAEPKATENTAAHAHATHSPDTSELGSQASLPKFPQEELGTLLEEHVDSRRASIGQPQLHVEPAQAAEVMPKPSPPSLHRRSHGLLLATPNETHVAPSVMVWTADYLTLDAGAPHQPPVSIVAGDAGATLLVWGVDPQALIHDLGLKLEVQPTERPIASLSVAQALKKIISPADQELEDRSERFARSSRLWHGPVMRSNSKLPPPVTGRRF